MILTNCKSQKDLKERREKFMKDLEDQLNISNIIEKTTNEGKVNYINPIEQTTDNRTKSYAEMAEDELYAKDIMKQKLKEVFKNGRDIDNIMSRIDNRTILFLIQFWNNFKVKYLDNTSLLSPDMFLYLLRQFLKKSNMDFDHDYYTGMDSTKPDGADIALFNKDIEDAAEEGQLNQQIKGIMNIQADNDDIDIFVNKYDNQRYIRRVQLYLFSDRGASPGNKKLTLEQYEKIKTELVRRSTKSRSPDITRGLVELIQEVDDYLNANNPQPPPQAPPLPPPQQGDEEEKEPEEQGRGLLMRKRMKGRGLEPQKRYHKSYITLGNKHINERELMKGILCVKYIKQHATVAKFRKTHCSDDLRDIIMDTVENNKVNDKLLKHLNEDDKVIFNKLLYVCGLSHYSSYTPENYRDDLKRYEILQGELEINDNPEIKLEMIKLLNKFYSVGHIDHMKYVNHVHNIC